jgi:hypothetical protein
MHHQESIREQPPITSLIQSKTQDQEIDLGEPSAAPDSGQKTILSGE